MYPFERRDYRGGTEEEMYYGKNSKTLLYKTINLLDKKQDIVLPDTKSKKDIANSFMSYFTEKIDTIRSSFDKSQPPGKNLLVQAHKLSTSDQATEDEIRQIVFWC